MNEIQKAASEITQLHSDILQLQGCQLTPKGAVFDGNLNYEEWEGIGSTLRYLEKSVLFWIGDWINYGEEHHPKKYSQALDTTGYEYQTLRHASAVCKGIDLCRRRHNLSFAHHQELYHLPIKDQEEWMDKAAGMTRDILRKAIRDDSLRKLKDQAAKEAKKSIKDEDYGVKLSDFRELKIKDNSIDLIFTDPPYDRETLPLYEDLAILAKRVLKPGGSLICYLGQYQIAEVLKLMTPHVRLWWTLACIHTGNSARMTEYGIVVKWKPMLWFVRDTRGDKLTFVEDLVVSEKEKQIHEWQQGIQEASYYIDKLTFEGQIVFDPFCGGGTTALAAKKLKRQWLTCDVDNNTVILARKRLHDNA